MVKVKRTVCVGDTVSLLNGIQAKVTKVGAFERVWCHVDGDTTPYIYTRSKLRWSERKQYWTVW